MTISNVQPPLDIHEHWPCKLPLSTAGYSCVWQSIGRLRRLLIYSGVPGLLQMTVDDLIAVLMEPLTFAPASPVAISQRLTRLAELAEVAPRAVVICLLGAEEVSSADGSGLLDLPSEEVTHG